MRTNQQMECPACWNMLEDPGRGEDGKVVCTHCDTTFLPDRVAAARVRRPGRSKSGRPTDAGPEDSTVERVFSPDGEVDQATPLKHPTLAPFDSDLVRGIRVGAYELIRRIGSGGFSLVFEAVHTSQDLTVALKILDPSYLKSREHQERFVREAFITAQVNHPNVVKVYGVGRDRERFYIAMELVDGPSMGAVIDRDGPFSPEASVEILLKVIAGLSAAHKLGVIHRDVKPDNILISKAGSIKLVDFGLARDPDLTSSVTASGVVIGTLSYMAPEQFGSAQLDTRVDIYALGATLFHMLTGRAPYDGEHPLRLMHRHHRLEPFVPYVSSSSLPESMCYVIQKMMAPRPDLRYGTLAEVEADLQRIQGGENIHEPPDEAGALSEQHLAFGEIALDQKLIGEEDLMECLRIQAGEQAAGETPRPVGEILVSRGLISPDKVPAILAIQMHKIVRCHDCRERYPVVDERIRKSFKCPACDGELRAIPSVSFTTAGDLGTVEVSGRVGDGSELEEEVADAIGGLLERDCQKIVVDVSAAMQISAENLGWLMHAIQTVREAGAGLAIVVGDGHAKRTLHRLGLESVLPVFDSSEDVAFGES